MKVLVFQIGVSGHWLQWAGIVARTLADAGADVTLALSKDAEAAPSFKYHVAPHLGHIRVDAWFEPAAPRARRGFGALQVLLESVKRSAPQRVYLPTADGIAQHVGALRFAGLSPFPRGVQVEALLMNGAPAYSQLGLKRGLWARASYAAAKRGGWSKFFHLDPFVQEWEAAQGVAPERRVETMPEPLEPALGLTRAAARKSLSLDPDGYYVGMTGGINERKGADLALLAFERAQLPRNSHLLLCGQASGGVRIAAEKLRQRPEFRDRVHLIDRFVSDQEMLTGLAALDLVLLPYSREHLGSSGIASRAIVAERPILITPGSWGEKMSQAFRIGWVAPLPNPEALARLLETCREAAQNWVAPPENTRFIEYNSIPNFAAHWSAGLCDALGVSPPAVKTWEWARGEAAVRA